MVGDSRGRQLYRAVDLYVNEKLDDDWSDYVVRDDLETVVVQESGFSAKLGTKSKTEVETGDKTGLQMRLKTDLKAGLKIHFLWSNAFFHWGKNSHQMRPRFLEAVNLSEFWSKSELETGEITSNLSSVIIIDQHLFWPIEEMYKAKLIPTNNNTDWVSNTIITPFVKNIVPILKFALSKNQNLKIVVIPAVEPIRPGRQNNVGEYVRIYNEMMKNVFEKHFEHRFGNRFIYLSVVNKLAISPDGSPLVPDGTHWMWNSRYGTKYHSGEIDIEQSLKIAATHVALLDVLFETVCGGFVKFRKVDNSCE